MNPRFEKLRWQAGIVEENTKIDLNKINNEIQSQKVSILRRATNRNENENLPKMRST